MPFTANMIVTKCSDCPYKESYQEKSLTIFICPEISSKPVIEFNGILSRCPYNKEEKDLMDISDYVKERNNK